MQHDEITTCPLADLGTGAEGLVGSEHAEPSSQPYQRLSSYAMRPGVFVHRLSPAHIMLILLITFFAQLVRCQQ